MKVYPNPDSWDEFYPTEIFIGLADTDTQLEYIPIIKKANIGATIVFGSNTASTTYKKVGDIKAIADIATSLVILNAVDAPHNSGG